MARKTNETDDRPEAGRGRGPWLGSHLSIAGGMHHALEAVEALGCDCVQVFTKNQRQWKSKPLAADDVAETTAQLPDPHSKHLTYHRRLSCRHRNLPRALQMSKC